MACVPAPVPPRAASLRLDGEIRLASPAHGPSEGPATPAPETLSAVDAGGAPTAISHGAAVVDVQPGALRAAGHAEGYIRSHTIRHNGTNAEGATGVL